MAGSTYLWVNIACIAGPFLLSFDKRVAFYKTWKAFGLATLGTLAVFIPWDVWFTDRGVWGFNPEHLLGIDLINLPLEEWLFFISIPYACTFTFACLKHYVKHSPSASTITALNRSVAIGLALVVMLQYLITKEVHDYTLSACAMSIALLVLQQRVLKQASLGWFWIAYPILVIPFLIANGVLTGLEFYTYPLILTDPEAITDHIVWYNNAENMGVRVFSVPVDDFVYGFALILLNITLYEAVLTHRKAQA